MYAAQQFAAHAPSVEAVEQAYEVILKENMKYRKKFGFQPPSMGRKTDMRAQKVSSHAARGARARAPPSPPPPPFPAGAGHNSHRSHHGHRPGALAPR